METIRILIYTDSFDISEHKSLRGLLLLQQYIKLKIKGLANVELTLLNRHFDYQRHQCVQGATLLSSSLLKGYDELWIFGYRPANTRREPHNELKGKELKALSSWMQTGGVLITGDHSEPVGAGLGTHDHAKYINLGAAIGRNIPRAGQMRVLDGPPTNCLQEPLELRDNHNTQVGMDPLTLDENQFQSDGKPQTLRLTPSNPPHKLFWWRFDPEGQRVIPIDKFPDHNHEGDLPDPKTMNTWPSKSPLPQIVAFGHDKRFPDKESWYRIVSVYDGDSVGEGRIVADSSFHHYMDCNLVGLSSRDLNNDPVPDSDLDGLAQYYCNLALWLAPKALRDRMAWGLFFRAATHPDVLEHKANGPDVLGRTAMKVISADIGIFNLHRLLAPEERDDNSATISLAVGSVFLGTNAQFKDASERELTLGHIIEQYHQFFAETGFTDLGCLKGDPEPTKIILRALRIALNCSLVGKDYLALFQSAAKELK